MTYSTRISNINRNINYVLKPSESILTKFFSKILNLLVIFT